MLRAQEATARFDHPLTAFVMALFTDDRAAHDRVTVAAALGQPSRPPEGVQAYRLVAEDVLEVLRLNGLLTQDEHGWYRRSP